jgi:hypothetical protein
MCAPLTGYTWITSTSELNSVDSKVATATCPSGTQLVGVSGDVSAPVNFVERELVLDNISHFNLNFAAAAAHEDQDGTGANWAVIVGAICAVPPAGLEHVTATSDMNSFNKDTYAECSSNKIVLSAGAEILSGDGEVRITRADFLRQGVIASGHEDEDGTDRNWSIRAHAICALP